MNDVDITFAIISFGMFAIVLFLFFVFLLIRFDVGLRIKKVFKRWR